MPHVKFGKMRYKMSGIYGTDQFDKHFEKMLDDYLDSKDECEIVEVLLKCEACGYSANVEYDELIDYNEMECPECGCKNITECKQ